MEAEREKRTLEIMAERAKTISQAEAAKILGISKTTVSTQIKKGKIKAIGKPPKPLVESIIQYKTNPNMRRKRKNE